MNYFDNVSTLEELKQLYKKLLFELHPELGGTEEEFNELKKQYKEKLASMVISWESDKFDEVLIELIHFENLKIEVLGQWIWCFNSKEYHEQLKNLGLWFSKSKKAWVFSGNKKSNYRSHNSMEDLRKKWAVEV